MRDIPQLLPTIILTFLLILHLLFSRREVAKGSMYTMVVDAGSTGSRLHIFQFSRNAKNELTGIKEIGTKKQKPGLSSFASHPDDVYKVSYQELFNYAKTIIPYSKQKDVNVYVFATAGMRLLPHETQKAIYDNIYDGFNKDGFSFILNRENMKTISGKDEAYYGWLAANYLGGSISANLKRLKETVGSLDLGGASTQILFEPTEYKQSDPLDPNKLFMYSFLGFGAEQIRDRFIRYILMNRDKYLNNNNSMINNPCYHKGYIDNHNSYPSLKTIGTGNYEECHKLISLLLKPDSNCNGTNCKLFGLNIPPVRGEFYAMSLFYFALNSIKSYTNLLDINENKNPSINDLEKGTKALCEIPWSKLSSDYKDSDKYTDAGTLPFRCFQLSYILVLLHEGYGFSNDSHNVHFVGSVNGGEVEWSLGVGLISGNNESNNNNDSNSEYNISVYIYYISLICGICASGCLWYSIYDKCQNRRKKSYQLIPVKVSDVDLV